jgi:diacylglycerol kinase (ATP)
LLKPSDSEAPLESPFKGKKGLTRAFRALSHSTSGLKHAWRHESAFRQEVVLAAILIPIAAWAPVAPLERALMIGVVLLVLVVELLNSSVETAIDRISLDHHELSGRAKDIGSAAVFVSLILCVTVWALILLPHFQ